MIAERTKRHTDEAQERTCALTRIAQDPARLIRFVAGPDGTVVPDIRRKLPGRGVWITGHRDKIGEAVRKNVFARGLKTSVRPDPDLAEQVDLLLLDQARQSLAMANKAGMVVTGAFKVEKSIARGNIAAVIQATDGSPDGRRKMLASLTRSLGEAAGLIPVIEIFDSNQLDLALGHTNVIHAALKQGAASEAFLARCLRLSEYRGALSPAATVEAPLMTNNAEPEPGSKAEVK